MLVDSHCHLNMLDLTPYHGDLSLVLREARLKGVDHFLCVAVTLADHPELVDIAKMDEKIFISAGLHPNELPGELLDQDCLLAAAAHPKVIAIGETGLDYYRSEGALDWQRTRFIEHISCAKQTGKPLIVHTRQAKEDTLAILKAQQADQVGGVMHCFTEDWHTAKQALDLNFYISFSGIVTFKNATSLQEVVKKMPLNRILIETDAPYLAPVPYRGKSNVPAYVFHVAEFIAALRNEHLNTIAEHTTQNFFTLFASCQKISHQHGFVL